MRLPPPRLVAVFAIALALTLALIFPAMLARVVASRILRASATRGFVAGWSSLGTGFPANVRMTGLVVLDPAAADTVFAAESLSVSFDPWSLLRLRARVVEARLAHARLRAPARRSVDPDTLPPEEAAAERRGTQERVRRLGEQLARFALLPTRELPRLSLSDVTLERGRDADAFLSGVSIERLEVEPARGGVRMRAVGVFELEQLVPFEASLDYGRNDRLEATARFEVPDAESDSPDTLEIALSGAIRQDQNAGVITISDSTRLDIGSLPFRVGGSLSLRGPRFRLALAADQLTADEWKESLPRSVLGPLLELVVSGSYDTRVRLDLDLAQPDSVALAAEVIPHGLQLDASRTELPLLTLDQPFVATIHLPHGRTAVRELSSANPHFRALDQISPLLAHAVVTNEDGGFFRHRGFNTEAVKLAIAENLKAGAYRRGAGTITMQLARNLWLGHERSLSRKGQEVVLAWVLEHLTGLTKERMLEIYLNVIEWGPGVHGADEAARFYFDRDVRDLTVPQALFLTTVIPAPTKWRYRFDPDGSLRPFERAQMHFIGRAMIGKGWLDLSQLTSADSLEVHLAGPARELFTAPKSAGAGQAKDPI